MVFVRTAENSWISNDLYIVTRSDTSSPFDSVRSLIELNSPDTADAYPWISPDGLRLYFTKGDGINDELLVSTRQDLSEAFSALLPLNIDFVATRNFSCWLSNDELEIYFTTGLTGDSVMYAIRQNPSDMFPAPRLIQSLSKYSFVSGISIAGDELYLYNANLLNSKKAILTFHRVTTSVEAGMSVKPIDFILEQNYPNPFNPVTKIQFDIPNASFVTLELYNVLSQEVATLVNEKKEAGKYEARHNASNIPSGMYFYRIQVGDFTETKKILLVR
jgi:hypothetical protein